MRRLAMVLVAAVAATSVWAGSATANRGSRGATPARPMLVALEPGVEITPLINSGDHVGDAFQYTGVPDGIGIYQSAPADSKCSRTTNSPTGTAILRGHASLI